MGLFPKAPNWFPMCITRELRLHGLQFVQLRSDGHACNGVRRARCCDSGNEELCGSSSLDATPNQQRRGTNEGRDAHADPSRMVPLGPAGCLLANIEVNGSLVCSM